MNTLCSGINWCKVCRFLRRCCLELLVLAVGISIGGSLMLYGGSGVTLGLLAGVILGMMSAFGR